MEYAANATQLTETALQSDYAQLSLQIQAEYRSSGDSALLHRLARLAREAGELAQARAYLLLERQLLDAGSYIRLAANAFEMACLAQLRKQPGQALLYGRASLRYALLGRAPEAELQARDLLAQLTPQLGEHSLAHLDAYLDAYRVQSA